MGLYQDESGGYHRTKKKHIIKVREKITFNALIFSNKTVIDNVIEGPVTFVRKD